MRSVFERSKTDISGAIYRELLPSLPTFLFSVRRLISYDLKRPSSIIVLPIWLFYTFSCSTVRLSIVYFAWGDCLSVWYLLLICLDIYRLSAWYLYVTIHTLYCSKMLLSIAHFAWGRAIIQDTEAFLIRKEKYVFFFYLFLFLKKELPREIICTLIRVCFSIEKCPGEMISCSIMLSR